MNNSRTYCEYPLLTQPCRARRRSWWQDAAPWCDNQQMSPYGRPSRQRDLKEKETGGVGGGCSIWNHHREHGDTWMMLKIKITLKTKQQRRHECRLRSTFIRKVHLRPNVCSDWLQVHLQPRCTLDYAHAVAPRCGKAAPPDSAHWFCLTATPRRPCSGARADLPHRRHKPEAAAVSSQCGWSAALTWDFVTVRMWSCARVTPALCGTARRLFGCRKAAPLLNADPRARARVHLQLQFGPTLM